MSTAPPIALTIAGSDPSGGAGIQADLKTFHQFGVYGEAVITLITVQNTKVVQRVECLAPDLVADQIRAVLDDVPPHAIKLGALGKAEIMEAVADALSGYEGPIVVDPVMVTKHGSPLMDTAAIEIFKRILLPRAALLTPNLPEAAALTGMRVETEEHMRDAARALTTLGAHAVLIKGGHLPGDRALDVLFYDHHFEEFAEPHYVTQHTHGTGCTYAAAITAELARQTGLHEAVSHAKAFVTNAIRTAPGLGKGTGPVNHLVESPSRGAAS